MVSNPATIPRAFNLLLVSEIANPLENPFILKSSRKSTLQHLFEAIYRVLKDLLKQG